MKKVVKILLIIIAILVLVCLISIWISYNWLTVSDFTVTSSKISEPFRMVLISDLHDHQFGRHNEKLAEKIQAIANMTIQQKVCKHMGERIQFDVVKDGDSRTILGCPVTFFDIGSTKAKQFGFTMQLKSGKKFTCVGDEPYNEVDYKYVKGSDWLLHEAFCLFGEADKFKPYEKHHSTVKEACQLAEELGVPNLLLYHTEETHLAERKKLYTEEGQQYYHGNLYVPDDLETFEL